MTIKQTIYSLVACIILVSCDHTEKKEINENKSRVDRLPFYNEANFTAHWIDADDPKLDTFHQISPFQLTNQDGVIISEQSFKGKIYIADFFFTSCPGICPNMTANMWKIQQEFLDDDDVLLLSHSVTPDKDSVPILKLYAENHEIVSDKWHLVTGTQKDIYKLGRKDYFVEEDLGLIRGEDEFLHTENFVLIDRNRHIRGIYNGLRKAAIRQLIADIHLLKEEQ